MSYFTELEQIILKFTGNPKRPHIATVILKNKNKVGGIVLINMKLYYKAMVMKAVQDHYKNRQ